MKLTVASVAKLDRTAFNLTRLTADSAGTEIVPADQFYRIGQVNMGIQIQAIGAGVTVAFTSYPVEEALSVDNTAQQALIWKPAEPAIAAGDMKLFPVACTAIKLTFSGPGEAIICSF